jgi:hypothetical protein
VRLSVNTISKGGYYKAGEEIPKDELSPVMRKYAVTVSEDGAARDYQKEIKRGADHTEPKRKLKVKGKRSKPMRPRAIVWGRRNRFDWPEG